MNDKSSSSVGVFEIIIGLAIAAVVLLMILLFANWINSPSQANLNSPTPSGDFSFQGSREVNVIATFDKESPSTESQSQPQPTDNNNSTNNSTKTSTSASSQTSSTGEELLSIVRNLKTDFGMPEVDYSRPAPTLDISSSIPSSSSCTSVTSSEINKYYYKCGYGQEPSGINCKAIAPYDRSSTLWSCSE